jgi:hypothetical protein
VALGWALLEIARGNREASAKWFDRTIAIDEQMFKKTTTPAYAWNVAKSMELAAKALPDTAPQRRARILAVWKDQNQRFPGHPYIEQQLEQAGKNQ